MKKGLVSEAQSKLTRDEFCRRFRERLLQRAGPTFDDGESIADYADETAPSYYEEWCEETGPMTETPEDCADADMSYWGED
jgi:hypothetical protein